MSEGWGNLGSAPMCDYSLQNVRTRPAKVGDKLNTRRFNYSTLGFSAPEDKYVAVCVLPGTELSFAHEVRRERVWFWSNNVIHLWAAMERARRCRGATVLTQDLAVPSRGAR
jgi:hypothetical protein